MKIFGVIFFSLIFTVVLFMASTLGMSLLWIEFHNHTGQDPLRLKFVFEDIFLIPNVLIFVSIWFIYIKVKIRNIRKEQEQKRILDENLFFERKEKKIAEEKIRKEKEKEKQKAEDKRIKEEQEQKLILDEERKEKKIAEEKTPKKSQSKSFHKLILICLLYYTFIYNFAKQTSLSLLVVFRHNRKRKVRATQSSTLSEMRGFGINSENRKCYRK